MRLIDADELLAKTINNPLHVPYIVEKDIREMSTVQPELTDEQAIEHLQLLGWMQRHDKEMYESGLREQLADDSDDYVKPLEKISFTFTRFDMDKWEMSSHVDSWQGSVKIECCPTCGRGFTHE